MMVTLRAVTVMIATTLLLGVCPASAQDGRDPTVAPTETGTALQSPTGVEGMTVLVRNNVPYLVVGTRLYAPGDKVGNLRVERISETEVWFHDGTTRTKVPRFAGIQRKVIATHPQCAAPIPQPAAKPAGLPQSTKANASKKKIHTDKHYRPRGRADSPLSAVAPCEDAQP